MLNYTRNSTRSIIKIKSRFQTCFQFLKKSLDNSILNATEGYAQQRLHRLSCRRIEGLVISGCVFLIYLTSHNIAHNSQVCQKLLDQLNQKMSAYCQCQPSPVYFV